MTAFKFRNLCKKLLLFPFFVSMISPLEASIDSKIIQQKINQENYSEALNEINNTISSDETNALNYLYRGVVYLHLANFYWDNDDNFTRSIDTNQKAINDFDKAIELYKDNFSKDDYPEGYLHIVHASKGHALYNLSFNFVRNEKKKAKEIFNLSIEAFTNAIALAPVLNDSVGNKSINFIAPPNFYYRVLFDEGDYKYTKSQGFLDRAIVYSYAALKKSKSFCKDLKESKKLGNVQAINLVRINRC